MGAPECYGVSWDSDVHCDDCVLWLFLSRCAHLLWFVVACSISWPLLWESLALPHKYPVSGPVRFEDRDAALEAEEPQHVSAGFRVVYSLRVFDQGDRVSRKLPKLLIKTLDLCDTRLMP